MWELGAVFLCGCGSVEWGLNVGKGGNVLLAWMKGKSNLILGRNPLHLPDEGEWHSDSWAESFSYAR